MPRTAMPRTACAVCLAVFAAAILSAPPVAAKSAVDTYEGRTVTVLVGYGAGGTYGQTTLLLSQYLDKTIPGHPTIVVQYMTGAGGLKMANYAYNVAPKNGLYMLMPPELAVVSEVLRPEKIKYDASKFTWIGRVFGTNQVMVIRRDSGVSSLAGMTKTELPVASSGVGSPTDLVPTMANVMLGTKFKLVMGYTGMAGCSLSMERKETMGMSGPWSYWHKTRSAWFKGGNKSFVVPLFQSGVTKEPDLPNVPLLTALAKTPDDKAAATLLATSSVIGRGLAFPPGVPKELVDVLRTAFWSTVNDPAFKQDAAKRKLPWSPMKGAEIQKIVDHTLAMSPAVATKIRKMVFNR